MKSRFNSIFNIFTLVALLASLLSGAVSVTPAYAAGFTVNSNADVVDANPGDGVCEITTSSGVCTLRAAIQEANVNSGDDIINIPADIYTLSIIGADEDSAATGDLDITENLTINGAGANVTIIQAGLAGAGIDRVFQVFTTGTVNISGVTIANGKCAACAGGGISNNGNGILTVTDSVISDNSAMSGNGGGGIYNVNSSLTVTGSTFTGNTTTIGNGGAVLNFVGTAVIANSTFSNNSAGSWGVIYNDGSGVLSLMNDTVSGNTGQYGGVLNSIGTLNMSNTILANNGSNDCTNSGTIGIDTNNLIMNNDACGIPIVSADPNLGTLANNGGPTQTFALQLGSPAIDAGDDATCAAAPVNNLDQRGEPRPIGAHCDIGAYESSARAAIIVNSASDDVDNNPGDGICEISPSGSCTLRAAIEEANATANTVYGPDVIGFSIGAPYTISPGSSLPTIFDPVIIDGGNNVILDGSGIILLGKVNRSALQGTNAALGIVNGLTLNTNDSTITNLAIRNFSGAGVAVIHSLTNTGNKIIQNSIYNNGNNVTPDIDLGDDGVTFNHVDQAYGANNYQNYPVLTLATIPSDRSSLRVKGTLEAEVNEGVLPYTIHVYANQNCHSTFFGGGQTYLGSFDVETGAGTGFVSFDQTLLLSANVNEPNGISVTATGNNGTSEFSYCRPVSTENLNWVQAYAYVASTDGGYYQYITDNYQEKWFKFPVHPGDRVHINLTGLSGSAITLHTDPNLIYNQLIDPTGEAGLSAEASGSAFLPSGSLPSGSLPSGSLPSGSLPSDFLPSGSLPSGSLPSGSLPSGSLPSGSLPSGSLPSGSLPSGSLPSGSLPSGSLPSGSLPSGSLPSGSLPSGSLPSGSLPSGSLDAYASAARQSLIAVSMNPYTTTQSIDRNTYDYMGDLYVRVVGRYSLQTPFNLDVWVESGVCGAIQPVPDNLQIINGSASAGSYKSLILTDSSRLAGTPTEIAAALAKLQILAARSDVIGVVIDLAESKYQRVAWANTQADANLPCPTAKNMVADEIKNVIGEYRNANTATLEYIVLAGGANVIPYFQVPDVAGQANEKDYVVPVAPSTASEAGLLTNLVQGQDSYGSQVEVTQGGYKLAYPDLAVGRLVDSASDISIAVNAYIATNGLITPHSSLITGYDFVGDAAIAIKEQMDAGTNSVADTLIQLPGLPPTDPTAWTAPQLKTKLLAGNFDVAVLVGHYSAGTLLAADYATQISAEEILYSNADLKNVLFLTLGCHGGYTIPGNDILNNASPDPDWAKAFLRKGAAGYVAATGYAYGDTELVEYGERLFVLISKQLRTGNDPVSVGNAMMAAKRKYLADTAQMTGIDQKTIIEMTLYGLPMMKVNMPGARLAVDIDIPIIGSTDPVGGAFGLGGAPASLSPEVKPHTKSLDSNGGTIDATYYTGADGVVANPFEPILPKEIYDVSVDGKVLRGVAFRGGKYTDQDGITPLTSTPATELSTGHLSFNSEFFYPTQLWMTNFFDAFNGGSTRLVIFPTQFKSTGPGKTDGILRTFSNLDLQLYYLPSNWTDGSPEVQSAGISAAPSILGVSADEEDVDINGHRYATFSVNASADGSAGVQSVWVVYTGKPGSPYYGEWTQLNLTQNINDPMLWEGQLDLAVSGANADDVQFMVQAVGGAGLTTLDTNDGAYYTVTPFNAVPPPPATETTLTFQSPPASGTYRQDSSFDLLLQTSPGEVPVADKVVTLDIGGQQALAVTDAFGQATITMNLNIAPGYYTAEAGFHGDSEYLSSTASSPFTVNKSNTAVTLLNSPIRATLTDAGANVLSGKSLVFVVHNGANTFFRSVFTDYQGQAQLGSVPLPPGTYDVDVYFNGVIPGYATLSDDYYESRYQLGLPSSAKLIITEWHEIRPPTVSVSAKKADGTLYTADTWTNQTVTVNFTCVDTQSGVASCLGADQIFSADGSFTADVTATDYQGNSGVTSFGLIKIDKTAPTLAPSVFPKIIYLNTSATASAGAADSGSGIASQSCGAIVTNTIGSKLVTCTATDVVGNTASVNLAYKVVYKFAGFYSPARNLPALNRMQAGKAVKLIFSLNGNQGLKLFATGYPRSSVIKCGSALGIRIATVTAASSSLKYSSSTKRYTYTWKTSSTWAGTCRQFSIKLKDGKIYKLNFKFTP